MVAGHETQICPYFQVLSKPYSSGSDDTTRRKTTVQIFRVGAVGYLPRQLLRWVQIMRRLDMLLMQHCPTTATSTIPATISIRFPQDILTLHSCHHPATTTTHPPLLDVGFKMACRSFDHPQPPPAPHPSSSQWWEC